MLDVPSIASNVTLGADGIWRCADHEAVSYPAGGNDACFQIEESSFWFNHRNACIVAAVTRYPPPERGPIFDVGGGNGFVSMGLIKAGFEAVLVEPGPTGAVNGKRRGVSTVMCATTAAAGFARATLHAVGVFDVIEHTENDLEFLRSIRALLKEGGRLYATVPAYNALWSDEDVSAGHFRRYTRTEIVGQIERAGFRLEYSTYVFRPLPLPILLRRTLPYRLRPAHHRNGTRDAARDHTPAAGRSAAIMDWLLRQEVSNVDAGRRMNFGGSCLVVASAA